jgi:hypothetical protein
MVELQGGEPMINILPHLASHPKGILGKEWFLLEEGTKRVRRSAGIPGYDKAPKLRGSMNIGKECKRNHINCMGL